MQINKEDFLEHIPKNWTVKFKITRKVGGICFFMGRKLTLEKKVEMIEYDIKYGRSRASKPLSITWLIKKYKIHGIDGLKTSSTNRIYSIELKKEIISKYLEGESIEKYI